jgi:hypothetical protein
MDEPRSAVGLSQRGRRRIALGLAGLAAVPLVLVAACGNAVVRQRDDTRPEPNASTEGVRSVFPTLPPVTPQGTAQPLKSGAGQSEGTGAQ